MLKLGNPEQLNHILISGSSESERLDALIQYFSGLINDRKINPKKILIITFKKTHVAELKRRIKDLLPPKEAGKVRINTFLTFSKRVINGVGIDFDFCFPNKAVKIVQEVLNDDPSIPLINHQRTEEIIRRLRLKLRTSHEFNQKDVWRVGEVLWGCSEAEMKGEYPVKEVKKVYKKYAERLKELNILDFCDVFEKALEILQEKETKEFWNKKYRAILVYEIHDVLEVQLDILESICFGKENLFCIGDSRIKDYARRGGFKEPFEELKKAFPYSRYYELKPA